MNRYYWLKLHDDYFENPNIKIIEAMDNGADYILFLFKLKLISIRTEGYLRVTDMVPYNEKTLSTVTNTNIDVVRTAMIILIEFDLIEILEDKTIYVKCIEALIGSETDVARRVRKHREKQKTLQCNKVKQISNTELDIESEKEIDKEKNICIYSQEFLDFWEAYPRKLGKKAAWRKWEATLKRDADEYTEPLKVMLVVAGMIYAERIAKKKTEQRYIKLPATFLGPDEHWHDMLEGSKYESKRDDDSADRSSEASSAGGKKQDVFRADRRSSESRGTARTDGANADRDGRWQMPTVQ